MKVSQYYIEEFKIISQVFLPILLIGGLATFLIVFNDGYPWYTFIGAAIGLSIIIVSWTEKKYAIFITSLLMCAIIYSALSSLYS
jgi:hypothetical protein